MKIKIILIYFFNFFIYFSIIPYLSEGNPPKDMVFIKNGCFKMGTNSRFEYQANHYNDRERPVHKVCLGSFYLERYEATQKQWENIMKIKLNIHSVTHHGDNLPMSRVDWDEAKNYCERKGRRLPTEAEWEYAARSGSSSLNFWGDDIDYKFLWFEANSIRRPHPIGTKNPSSWGLFDIIGSVWEWVDDWFSESYYKESPIMNPKGPKRGSHHVIRGASWIDSEKEIRSSARYPGEADLTQDFLVGVRCAKNIDSINIQTSP